MTFKEYLAQLHRLNQALYNSFGKDAEALDAFNEKSDAAYDRHVDEILIPDVDTSESDSTASDSTSDKGDTK